MRFIVMLHSIKIIRGKMFNSLIKKIKKRINGKQRVKLCRYKALEKLTLRQIAWIPYRDVKTPNKEIQRLDRLYDRAMSQIRRLDKFKK